MLLIIAICIRGQLSCEGCHKKFLAITIVKDQVLEGGLNNDSGIVCQSTILPWVQITYFSICTYLSTLLCVGWDVFNCKSQKPWLKLAKMNKKFSKSLKHPEAGQFQGPVPLAFWPCPLQGLFFKLAFPKVSRWLPAPTLATCFLTYVSESVTEPLAHPAKYGMKVLSVGLFGPIMTLGDALWWLA